MMSYSKVFCVLASVAGAARVDDDQVPSAQKATTEAMQRFQSVETDAAAQAEEAVEAEDIKQQEKKPSAKACSLAHPEGSIKLGGDPQAEARAAAVGAHAAKRAPAQVVEEAAMAAARAAEGRRDPEYAAQQAKKAAVQALGTPEEVTKAGSDAFAFVDARMKRTNTEVAAADVAEASMDALARNGSAADVVLAAHAAAQKVSEVDGSGSYMHADKMANVPKAPPSLGIAMTKGLRAMWAAHRANLSSGEIVEQALEAVNQAGGTPTVREDVAAIASDPETFAQETIFANYEKAGDEAAVKAENAGFPESLTAVVAARAAAEALKGEPYNTIDMELDAAKSAAKRVVARAHLSAADAADEAAMEAMHKMQDLGAYGQDVVNAARKAAIRTATKKGASHGEIEVIATDAETKVKKLQAQKAGWSTADKMWNTRVYWGADKREVERSAVGPQGADDPEDKRTWSADGDYDYSQAMPFQ